jgi:hypothetical protein
MAELGVAASVIELVNAGFALGKFLDDTYHDYKNAPTEVLEIATEVNICCELMQPLGEQLKAGSVRYTQRFETSVQALVDNVGIMPVIELGLNVSTDQVAVDYNIRQHSRSHS